MLQLSALFTFNKYLIKLVVSLSSRGFCLCLCGISDGWKSRICPLLLQMCSPFFGAAQCSLGAPWISRVWAVCAQQTNSADGNSSIAGCVHGPHSCGVNQGLHNSLGVSRYSSVPGTTQPGKGLFWDYQISIKKDTGWCQQIIAIIHPQKIMVHYKPWGFWTLAVRELLSIKPQSVCFHWNFARVGTVSLLRRGSQKVSASSTTVIPTMGIFMGTLSPDKLIF